MDFAKYAFNKSHAAAYAVISYQTAYLKCYFPVEFMAALMTSVIDNPGKVSEYIYTCRQMGIVILPPDINEGNSTFSVSKEAIRYGLSAIKGLGRPVIDAVVAEREENGKYLNLRDFATRLSGKEVNKRTVESFIKSGAFSSLHDNRRQLMMSYVQILDQIGADKKKALTGQMTLFDFAEEEDKHEYDLSLPEVSEYSKEQLLSLEKEVLGIYVSGHPLEAYLERIKNNATAKSTDFLLDEETNKAIVVDSETQTIGGMITSKTIKTTRSNSMMAFITLEDLFGVVEVIIFPRDYEKYKHLLEVDNKVFIRGKVTAEEEKAAKLICQEITSFDSISQEVWIKYPNKETFVNNEQTLYSMLSDYDGNDTVFIYCECEKVIKQLPKSRNIKAEKELIDKLVAIYKEENIIVKEKSIEKLKEKY